MLRIIRNHLLFTCCNTTDSFISALCACALWFIIQADKCKNRQKLFSSKCNVIINKNVLMILIENHVFRHNEAIVERFDAKFGI